jgi:hypothetical protein
VKATSAIFKQIYIAQGEHILFMENNEEIKRTPTASERRGVAVAKRRTKKIVALSVLALFMALSIGLTFTFWATGILGTSSNNNGNFNIGSGSTIETEFDLEAMLNFNQGATRLIPQGVYSAGIVRETANATDSVSANFSINWVATDAADVVYLAGTINTLTVALSTTAPITITTPPVYPSIVPTTTVFDNAAGSAWRYRDLNETGADRYYTAARLFEIELFNGATSLGLLSDGAITTAIVAGTPLDLRLEVRMNIPYRFSNVQSCKRF